MGIRPVRTHIKTVPVPSDWHFSKSAAPAFPRAGAVSFKRPKPRLSFVRASEKLNRIGRRTIIFMVLIAALAVIWNLLGA